MSTILERIDERLVAVSKSRRKASIEANLGADYIRDLARAKNASPSMSAIEALAPVLETTVDYLRGSSPNSEGTFRPAPAALGGEDLPLFRSVEGGRGCIVVPQKPIRHIARPKRLQDNDDAFAVVVSGESMSPEYEAGDMLFVDPYRPMVRDRNFIFIDDRQGDWTACVKRLLSWDDEAYHVLQHNPGPGQTNEFDLFRAEWPKVYRVLGKFDRD